MRMATIALVTSIAAAGSAVAQVKTTAGLVQGKTTADGKVRVFLGIPYAAPPVGEFRWKAPQPAAAWQGVRKATAIRPALRAGAALRRHHVSAAGERGLPQPERLDAGDAGSDGCR